MVEEEFHILHFNDVYNVEAAEKTKDGVCGGASRFTTALKEQKNRDPDATLTLFSGDALSPSIISTITNGVHMIPVLNEMSIDCAVIGNHDFDFGVDNLMECIKNSNFPWLNSNCYDRLTNGLLCNLPPCFIIEKKGVRFGIIGLVEPAWIETLAMVDEDNVFVKDFCIEGRKLANRLRTTWDCDIIIALTHMRWPNDRILAERVPEIDLILGGHDHDSGFERIRSVNGEDRFVVKSGTDFRQMKRISFKFNTKSKEIILDSLKDEDIFIKEEIPEDPVVRDLVESTSKTIIEKLEKIIGKVDTELDGRFNKIRTQETNLGNFLCDVAMTTVTADCCFINSGSIRIDSIIPPGPISLKTLNLVLPGIDPIVILELTGNDILEVLENSVSKVPALEGRFAQVSNINFAYSKSAVPGKRVIHDSVKIDGKPLVKSRRYNVAMNQFMSSGKDGYDVFNGKRVILDPEESLPLITAVTNYFLTIQVINGMKKRTNHFQHLTQAVHRQSTNKSIAVALSQMLGQFSMPKNVQDNIEIIESVIQSPVKSLSKHKSSDENLWGKLRSIVEQKDQERCQICPKIEDRIVALD